MKIAEPPTRDSALTYPRRMGERRWLALDGLRGVAVLMVLVDHAGLIPGAHPVLGAAGVTIFFVLSGFLITHVIVAARDRGDWSMRRFLMARVVRLLPALLTMQLVVTVWWLLAGRPFADIFWQIVSATLYLENMFPGDGGSTDLLAHTWSLATEEQFYLLWPLALPLALRTRSPMLLIVTGVLASMVARLVLGFNGQDGTHVSLPANAFALLLGGLLVVETANVSRSRAQRAGVYVGLALICALVTTPLILAPIGVALVAMFVVAFALPGVPLLELGWLRFVGRISYALYLWHWPVLVLTGHVLSGVSALPALALSFVLAVASTVWLEEPVRRRWRARQTTPAKTLVRA